MKILAIDIGTGTQDIMLFDTTIQVENCVQMIMPSPTVIVARQIREATDRGEDILLSGTSMGGGPSSWAADDHLRAGYRVFATPRAAKSFNDDLTLVAQSGVQIVSDEEAARLPKMRRINMRDVDLGMLQRACESFGVDFQFDALVVAVFDHGNAPPGYSDRIFRFEFLAERLKAFDNPTAFAFMQEQIPPRLSRMQAVAESLPGEIRLMVMDTAPAAILGTLEDDHVRARRNTVIVNIGNFHTLAFRLEDGSVTGLFEHHTSELKTEQLETFIGKLVDSTLTHDEVFNSRGHGAMLLDPRAQPLDLLAVVGPRREMLLHSSYHPYFATPYGNMMLAGCFGLIRAFTVLNPDAAEEINRTLRRASEIVR